MVFLVSEMVCHGNFTQREENSHTSFDGKLTLGIVKQLALEDKIDPDRETYACRDTFMVVLTYILTR